MLSGFVLAYNYSDRFQSLQTREVLRFYTLRLARIYPVHVATLFAVLAMVMVSHAMGIQLTDEGYTARDFVLNLLLAHTWVPHFHLNWNYPSWSISSEWFAYLLFPFFVAGPLKLISKPFSALIFGVAALTVSIGMILLHNSKPFHELLLVLPNFLLGAAIYYMIRGRHENLTLQAHLKWGPEFAGVITIAACFLAYRGFGIAIALSALAGCILSLASLRDNCYAYWRSRAAAFVGEVSYSLYMTHTIAQKLLYELAPASNFDSAGVVGKLMAVALYAFTITAATLLCFYIIEKPSRVWIRHLSRPSRVDSA